MNCMTREHLVHSQRVESQLIICLEPLPSTHAITNYSIACPNLKSGVGESYLTRARCPSGGDDEIRHCLH